VNTQFPLPYRTATRELIGCVANTARLLARGSIYLLRERVGMRLRFADGTSARVYQDTVVDGAPQDPCVLLVEFRLNVIRGTRGYALFRWGSLLNTPLFIDFPGFVSKLWLENDQYGVYRRVYESDGPQLVERYARSLWCVLALGSVPSSIHNNGSAEFAPRRPARQPASA
jgi:hypothetical protein